MDYEKLAKKMLDAGKPVSKIREMLEKHFRQKHEQEPRYGLCEICDTDIDDETCPACNGEGKILDMSVEFIPKDSYDGEVNQWLEVNAKEYFKRQKIEEKESIVIEHHAVPYDGDFGSINYMSAALAVSNFKFNQLLAQGVEAKEAYEIIYKSTRPWKGADNKAHNVHAESVGEVLEKTMIKVSEVLGL